MLNLIKEPSAPVSARKTRSKRSSKSDKWPSSHEKERQRRIEERIFRAINLAVNAVYRDALEREEGADNANSASDQAEIDVCIGVEALAAKIAGYETWHDLETKHWASLIGDVFA